jgi:tRNA modification GTPase
MREGLQKIVSTDETIVAISTPPGRAAIGVIRISGAAALEITERLFRTGSREATVHRQVRLGHWCDAEGNRLDQVMVTAASGPHTYTGENLVEVSAHGNPVVLRSIVQSIIDVGARLAGPGEFTLRAVVNGKMDLIQAEAVRDFVEAQTEQQARIALRQIRGAGAKCLAPLKDELVDLIAHLEAGIDFAEDDVDIPGNALVMSRIDSLSGALSHIQNSFGYGRILTQGAKLALVGKPNVGKSSLFNRLLASNRSIVTDVPGTTRDVIAEVMDLDGIPMRLMDTAGWRDSVDQIERIGVDRSRETLADADLVLVVLDGSRSLDSEDGEVLDQAAAVRHVVVVNKSDLPRALELQRNGQRTISVSAVTGFGLEELRSAIRDLLLDRNPELIEDFVVTTARQNEAVAQSVEALKNAANAVKAGVPHEMVLLDLYGGLAALNELTGDVSTDDILGLIFASFCIGK